MRIAVVDDGAADRLWLTGELEALLARRRLNAWGGGMGAPLPRRLLRLYYNPVHPIDFKNEP